MGLRVQSSPTSLGGMDSEALPRVAVQALASTVSTSIREAPATRVLPSEFGFWRLGNFALPSSVILCPWIPSSPARSRISRRRLGLTGPERTQELLPGSVAVPALLPAES